VQYFEIFGNRAVYADGWLAGTVHRAPWEMKPRAALLDDRWELYDTRSDFSLANDLVAKNPAKLKEMQDLFMKEAVKYRVLPIDDRLMERLNAKLVGRPDLIGDRTSLTLHAGMKGMSENVFPNIKNRSLTITADVEVPQGGADGVVLAQGGRFGGWSLYFKDGRPVYTYNFLGLQRFNVGATQAVPAGKATVRFDFAYDGGGPGKGGLGTIFVNGTKVAEARIERTQPGIFSADETADVGEDDATPVTDDYKAYDNKFTGKILKVTVDLKAMGAGEKAGAAKGGADAAMKIEAAK
jgi:arylsulfatase